MIVGGYERHPAPWCTRRPHPGGLQQPAARPGLGALRPARRGRPAGRTGARRRRRRSNSSTGRRRSRPTASSSSARATSPACSWPPASAPTGSPAPAASAGSSPSGSSDASRRWTCGRWTYAASDPSTPPAATASPARDEIYRTYYDIVYPNHERQAGRPLRTPAAFHRHGELGAEFGEKSGWERVNWYTSNEDGAHEGLRPRGWAGEHWSTAIVTESLATRNGRGAVRREQLRQARADGTGLRSPSSSSCARTASTSASGRSPTRRCSTVAAGSSAISPCPRLGLERFLLVTGTAFGRHDRSWIEQHAPVRRIRSGTRRHGRDGVPRPMGAARHARSWPSVCDDDLSFPYMQGRQRDCRRCAVLGTPGDVRRRARLGAVPRRRVRRPRCGTR